MLDIKRIRAEPEAVKAGARKKRIDVVLVWKFDHFARSTRQLLSALDEFKELGIRFISYRCHRSGETEAEAQIREAEAMTAPLPYSHPIQNKQLRPGPQARPLRPAGRRGGAARRAPRRERQGRNQGGRRRQRGRKRERRG